MHSVFVAFALKCFFLFTPFFGLSMFLAMTADRSSHERRQLAHRVAFATIVISGSLLFFGQHIFNVFGITVDAFRIGAGILLLLTAIALMNPKVIAAKEGEDISVVPLAMPVIVGPASCGALIVASADFPSVGERVGAFFAMAVAVAAVWVILLLGAWIEKRLGKRGISILMRLTALILAALSAQMIMTGVCGFLKIPV